MILLTCVLSGTTFSQAPQGINYQAVLRDATGVLQNQVVLIRFSVLSKSSGLISYEETHAERTNEFGLLNLVIGTSATHTGNFSDIAWGTDSFELKVELDKGNGFELMGMSTLMSVPYSLYANKAKEVEDISIFDLQEIALMPADTGDILKWNGAEWIPAKDERNDLDSDPSNEIQSLSMTGQDLVLSGGGGVVALPSSPWIQDSSNIYFLGGGIGVEIHQTEVKASLHIGEGKTVLFGADTLGKPNFYPDPKLMFLPGKGGAFRVGQLNADGSIIGGTGYDFWDPSNVGWASVAIGNNTKSTGAGAVALGIRAQSTNFGAVALGHLATADGNSSIAAGYYTRSDAFLSTAVGAGNVGGGNRNAWYATDAIFEVGNSMDTTQRSNALTVLKNGKVAINHHNPQAMLDIEQAGAVPGNGILSNLPGTGHWETLIDISADYNWFFNNSLKAYILDTDGTYIKTSDRNLKKNIQDLPEVLPRLLQLRPTTYQFKDSKSDAPLSTGFIAQEVERLFPNQVSEKGGIKGLKYDEFNVLAIKAIQEQQALIELQAKMIEELQQRLEKLENKQNQ